MKFGVREICNVVFKAKSEIVIGKKTFKKNQPVLYIDTAKTSTMEGSATTVYATGGRGNTNLIAWEGEKQLTFTVEDALLSPLGFAVLSGAGLFGNNKFDEEIGEIVHVHTTSTTTVSSTTDTTSGTTTYTVDLSNALGDDETIDGAAPIFIMVADSDGSIAGDAISAADTEAGFTVEDNIISGLASTTDDKTAVEGGMMVFVDYYVKKQEAVVDELQIDAEHFAGYYYVEADTLFRRQADGVDLPAVLTFPNVKIQSNFTFSMAPSGDPSTFTFTMDAFPGYTLFDKTKKVLCVMQIVNDTIASEGKGTSVMGHWDENDDIVDTGDTTTDTTVLIGWRGGRKNWKWNS